MKRNCDRALELSFDEAELTIALLARFIAERARQLATPNVSVDTAAKWKAELDEAARLHRTLDVRDTARVAAVQQRFRALLNQSRT
jgi:hypothetical protein